MTAVRRSHEARLEPEPLAETIVGGFTLLDLRPMLQKQVRKEHSRTDLSEKRCQLKAEAKPKRAERREAPC